MYQQNTIKIAITPKGNPRCLHASAFDTSRRWAVVLVDETNEIINIADDSVIYINVAKPDGNRYFSQVEFEDNTIYINTDEDLTNVAGIATAELIVYDSDNNRIASANFGIEIEKSISHLLFDPRKNIPYFDQLLQSLLDTKSEIETYYNEILEMYNELKNSDTEGE